MGVYVGYDSRGDDPDMFELDEEKSVEEAKVPFVYCRKCTILMQFMTLSIRLINLAKSTH